MSAGEFTKGKYQTEIPVSGAETFHIVPIRVQPETITCTVGGVANSVPAAGVTLPITAVVSRGRRSRGIVPRTVTLEAGTSGEPTGYKKGGFTTIPVLNDAFWAAVKAATDSTVVSYNGSTSYKVSYFSDERVR